jgi:hypothetical protein
MEETEDEIDINKKTAIKNIIIEEQSSFGF